jgi:Rrf2 family protein
MTRIVAQLARAGLLNTFPGREGGLMLPCPASQITLRDVVEAFEGPILLSECLQVKGEDDCPFQSNCPVRSKWGRVQVAMLREMAAITFESLALEAAGIPWRCQAWFRNSYARRARTYLFKETLWIQSLFHDGSSV